MSFSPFIGQKFRSVLPGSGVPNAGGKVYCYYPGTLAHKTAYSEPSLTATWPQPITLDGDGSEYIFLRGLYDIVVTDANDIPLSDGTFQNVTGILGLSIPIATTADYGDSLETAKSTLAGNPGTVMVEQPITQASSLEIPETMQLDFLRSGSVSMDSGATLDVLGDVQSGSFGVFSGAGSVVIRKGDVDAKWFGAKGDYDQTTGVGTDDTEALLAWLGALRKGTRGILPTGTYKVTDRLTLAGLTDFELIMRGQIAPHGTAWEVSQPYGVLEVSGCSRFRAVLNFRQEVQARFGSGHVALFTSCEDGQVQTREIWVPAYPSSVSGKAAIICGDGSKRMQFVGGSLRHAIGIRIGGGIYETTWQGVEDVTVLGMHFQGNAVDAVDGGLGFTVDSPHNKSSRVSFLGCRVRDLSNTSGAIGFAASGCDFVKMLSNHVDTAHQGFHIEDGCQHFAVAYNTGVDLYNSGVAVTPGAKITDDPAPKYGKVYCNSFESSESTFTAGVSVAGETAEVIRSVDVVGNTVNRLGTGEGFAGVQVSDAEDSRIEANRNWGAWQYGVYAQPRGNGRLTVSRNDNLGTYSVAADFVATGGGNLLSRHDLGLSSVLGDIPAVKYNIDGLLHVGGAYISDTTANHAGGGVWTTLKALIAPAGLLKPGRSVRICWRGKVFGAAAADNRFRIQLSDGTTTVELYTSAATTVAADHSFLVRAELVYKDSTDYPRLAIDGVWDSAILINSLIEGSTLDENAAITINFQAKTDTPNGVLLYETTAEVL